MDSLINLSSWRNPFHGVGISPPGKFGIDLITGKIFPSGREEDTFSELLKEKREWFVNTIHKRDSTLKDFDKALITITGHKEKVEIVFKGKEFVKETVW